MHINAFVLYCAHPTETDYERPQILCLARNDGSKVSFGYAYEEV